MCMYVRVSIVHTCMYMCILNILKVVLYYTCTSSLSPCLTCLTISLKEMTCIMCTKLVLPLAWPCQHLSPSLSRPGLASPPQAVESGSTADICHSIDMTIVRTDLPPTQGPDSIDGGVQATQTVELQLVLEIRP